ncbi:hypothetical protein HPB51_023877 [Rhipicephalus microplus]|uniref:Uncharacterized protein n=1 Tax=Rhipicephalus microplus TaxID=6941 RepID=A0A9J6DDF6_RHIMP|nr:hypothetical protein HPB51_023877 [Rhipicephalus microplus]
MRITWAWDARAPVQKPRARDGRTVRLGEEKKVEKRTPFDASGSTNLPEIMGDSERNASSADDPECAPSDLLDLMIAWKAKIRLQVDRDLQVGGQHQAKNETVKKMSEWGEQIKDLISKKELAEHATLEYKYEAADLKRENEQLRNYNDNLYSDIQSLLSIIDVARKTGNWEGIQNIESMSPLEDGL